MILMAMEGPTGIVAWGIEIRLESIERDREKARREAREKYFKSLVAGMSLAEAQRELDTELKGIETKYKEDVKAAMYSLY
jgi:hypothetical protein